jgi:transposase
MKKTAHHLITEAPRRQARPELTIGIDLGDVWSHYCTLSEDGEVVDRGRFRTTAKAIQKLFTDLSPTRVAMEAGVHSIWISEQLQELGHEVIVANVRELRAISHSDRKSVRSMLRSWLATHGSIQRFFGRSHTALSSNRRPSP